MNKGQNTDCFRGGTVTSVNGDTPLRACANQNCSELSDLAFGDELHGYCVRPDSAGNRWVGIFNTNGQCAGFARLTDLNLPPFGFFPDC